MNGLHMKLTLGAALLVGSALPALAQEGLCGGVGVNGQWIGGEEATSDIVTSPDYLEQMALVLMNNEYVANFTLSAPLDLRLEAEGRGVGDPVIDIRDAAGTIVASDDDSGGNSASRYEGYFEAGTYCLSLRSYDGAPMTGFVRVGRLEHEALTDGLPAVTDDPLFDPLFDPMAGGVCDLSLATYLGDGNPVDAMLTEGGAGGTASVNEVPYWAFVLADYAAITVTAENESADPFVTLYDEFGNYLAENDDYNGLNSQLDITYELSPGTYCIAMSALTDTALPITVNVTGYDATAALMGMYDRGEASPPLDGSYPVTMLGAVGNRFRTDISTDTIATWFAFDMAEPGLIVLESITNGMGDTTLTLFDDLGRQIAYNDDANDSLDSMLVARVMPGTYVVAVRQLSNESPTMTRMLFETYVRAE